MAEHSFWRFSRTLHRAINDRHFEEIEALLDEEVDWTLYGPIDMFPFLGTRHGKRDALDVIREISDNVQIRRFDRETTMLGVDSAASMLRCSLTARQSDSPSRCAWRSSPSSRPVGSSACVCSSTPLISSSRHSAGKFISRR